MDKNIFFGSKDQWNSMEPIDVLTLRAFTRPGVFIRNSQAAYFSQVSENLELSELGSFIFEDDFGFVSGLPDNLRNPMIQVMQMVYREGIRKADSRVKAM